MTIINGKVYPDGNICITDNAIFIDGVLQDSEKLSGIVKIEVTGNLKNLVVKQGSVNVKGNIYGNVDAGGSINCGNIDGDVDAGGSINCGTISGDVDAGGSVRHS